MLSSASSHGKYCQLAFCSSDDPLRDMALNLKTGPGPLVIFAIDLISSATE